MVTRTLRLASTSPRRRALLEQAGLPFVLVAPGAESGGGRDPAAAALARARSKALGAAAVDGLVLAVDTVVEVDGEELGKPEDRGAAAAMLRRLAGRRHRVYTAHVLRRLPDGATFEEIAVADVAFAPLTDAALEAFLDSGAWRGKAGAYGLQDEAAGFAELVSGARDTVVGLHVAAVRRLLQAGEAMP